MTMVVLLNCKKFSYFWTFTLDIIAQNTTHNNFVFILPISILSIFIFIFILSFMYLYRGQSASTSLSKGEGEDEESKKNDIERRVPSQKSDVPHTNSSI